MIDNHGDALKFLIHYLRTPGTYKSDKIASYSYYGYDVYLYNVMIAYLVVDEKIALGDCQKVIKDRNMSLYFLSASWELCRRGILRPGVKNIGDQSTEQGNAGAGFTITPAGEQWLSEAHYDIFVPTEPERFAQLVTPYREMLGDAFFQRAQEAVRCYNAHAYLACCVMCGAATESILLLLACQNEPETEVLKAYISSSGRSKVEQMVTNHIDDRLKHQFRGFLELLKYWRDTAAHGRATEIADWCLPRELVQVPC